MVEKEQYRGDGKRADIIKDSKKPAARRMPEVDFEKMNFEQRRAPYDSGSRIIDTEEHDKNRPEKGHSTDPRA